MLEFTPYERRVIIIISVVLICSAGFQLINPSTSSNMPIDYRKSDSIFSRRSHQAAFIRDAIVANKDSLQTSLSRLPAAKNKIEHQFILNINTADADDFKKLPRIGPSIARRIIAYRKEHGSFNSIDELTKVKGIGPKTLERIKPYLKDPD